MLRFGETNVTKEKSYAAENLLKYCVLILIILISQNQFKQKLTLII